MTVAAWIIFAISVFVIVAATMATRYYNRISNGLRNGTLHHTKAREMLDNPPWYCFFR